MKRQTEGIEGEGENKVKKGEIGRKLVNSFFSNPNVVSIEISRDMKLQCPQKKQ